MHRIHPHSAAQPGATRQPTRRPLGNRHLVRLASVSGLAVLAGCGSKHRLAEYQFSGQTVAVAPHFPAHPTILTSSYATDYRGDPVGQILKTGGQIAKDVAAHSVAEDLDSAASVIDMSKRVADRALERSARYLGARPVETATEARYVLEIVVRDYGIDARQWEDAAYVFVDAEAVLLDGATGAEVWSARVDEHDPITPSLNGSPSPTQDVVTAAVLADMSVEELARTLERVSDYCADRITDRLRADLRSVGR
jgi:hypothetical protein